MKNFILVTLFSASLAISSSADIIYPDGHASMVEPPAVKKLSRGIANTALFWLEIPKAMLDITQANGVDSLEQVTLGLFTRGPYKAVQRLRGGVYDLATAFDNGHPLLHLQPEVINPTDLLPGYDSLFPTGDSINTSQDIGNLRLGWDK